MRNCYKLIRALQAIMPVEARLRTAYLIITAYMREKEVGHFKIYELANFTGYDYEYVKRTIRKYKPDYFEVYKKEGKDVWYRLNVDIYSLIEAYDEDEE